MYGVRRYAAGVNGELRNSLAGTSAMSASKKSNFDPWTVFPALRVIAEYRIRLGPTPSYYAMLGCPIR